MPLDAGTRLGPYEILTPAGAGGMGEVYRARDTRLDRTVAIKVLPRHLAERPDLRQRLDREARAISSLSHPHICALYDVGHQDGVDFLVMEYLEGETLADRLAAGRIPPREIPGLGAQIAEALEAAHRNGVIHRDLKPGNVMLTKSGVKVLDFGLAKTAEPTPDPAAGVSRTIQGPEKPLTAEGTILGTFQYMAPEQLEGKEADPRTDLFALGAVLYEMATGRRAFEGRSQASLIASILKEEPPGMGELEPMTPPALERVVRACLAKDPDERIQTAHDVKLQLRWIAEGGSQVGLPPPVVARRRTRARLVTVAAAVLALTAGLVAGTRLPRREAVPPSARVSVIIPDDVTLDPEAVNLAISPDGRFLAFVAADSLGVSSLWLRLLDRQEVKALSGTERGALPFWSPDSRSLGFFADGKLKRIPVAGGAAQVICDAPDGRGGAWSREDVIVFAPTSAGPLQQVPAGGGEPAPATRLDEGDPDGAHRFPVFLPDDRHFLYVLLRGRGDDETRVGSLGSLESRPVLSANGSVVYAPPGYLLFERTDALLAQRFDPGKLEVVGAAVSLPDRPGGARGYGGSFPLVASTNRTLAYHASGSTESRLLWLDRTGRTMRTLAVSPGEYREPTISPEGSRAAVTLNSGTGRDIWLFDLERGVPIRFTHDPEGDSAPVWSPDGREILFASNRTGSESFYRQLATGAGEPALLLERGGMFNNLTSWAPDGRHLVFRTLDARTGDDLWLLPLNSGGEPTPLLASSFDEDNGVISPDGRWIAYRSNESGRHEVYVQAFPQLTEIFRISTDGCVQTKGDSPDIAWPKGGKELLYLGSDGITVMAVSVETEPAFRAGVPHPLFKLPRGSLDYAVTRDGEHFLVCAPGDESSGSALSVVFNWTSGLERN